MQSPLNFRILLEICVYPRPPVNTFKINCNLGDNEGSSDDKNESEATNQG